jgi:hypothetical protein
MAYFSNSTEGMAFYDECAKCKYGTLECPVHYVQNMYNYDACNNEVATKILSELVRDDGTCVMRLFLEKYKDYHPDQLRMF